MDPKKVVILILLVVMLIFVGKWGYTKYRAMNSQPPAAAGAPGYTYGTPANTPAPAAATPAQ